jgi:molybdopterin-guanine dinucleotide biosynthesis protein
MKPIIIGIGGSHSDSGKTTVACQFLERLPGWGAIKYTKTYLKNSIIEDLEIISEEGKDTRRFIDAGAKKVLWVQSPFSKLGKLLSMALEKLSHLEGIIIEGNSAIEVLNLDIVIFVSGSGVLKEGAERILRKAVVVISDLESLLQIPEGTRQFGKNDVERYVNFIKEIVRKRYNVGRIRGQT